MDFSEGGINNPHQHDTMEEIYFLLNGYGDMVAGRTTEGGELLHPSRRGDVYYYFPGTRVGFYSGNIKGETNSKILGVRTVNLLRDDKK